MGDTIGLRNQRSDVRLVSGAFSAGTATGAFFTLGIRALGLVGSKRQFTEELPNTNCLISTNNSRYCNR